MRSTIVTLLAVFLYSGPTLAEQSPCNGPIRLVPGSTPIVENCLNQLLQKVEALEQVSLLEDRVSELEAANRRLEQEIEGTRSQLAQLINRFGNLDGEGLLRVGDRVRISDPAQPNVVVTRHGNGGDYLNAYQIGHPNLGRWGSQTWQLVRE